jgi:hypothetical protein
MPSIVEDFSFIAKRVHEIRAARYHELGVSPPVSSEQSQPSVRQEPLAPTTPGFEPATSPPVDDWDRCFPPT